MKKCLVIFLILFGMLALFSNQVYAQENELSIEKVLDDGIQLYSEGRYNEALTYLDRVLEIKPNNVNALSYKGACFVGLGLYSQSQEFLDKALEIDENHVKALSFKAQTLGYMQRLNDGLSYADKALKLAPEDVDALISKGIILMEFGKYSEAKQNLNKALDLDPENIEALSFIGLLEAVTGNYNLANSYIDQALNINSKHFSPLFSKAIALSISRNDTEANQFLDKALDVNPEHPDLLSVKALISLYLRNDSDALIYSDKALEVDPSNSYALSVRATVLSDVGSTQSAMHFVDYALQINSKDVVALSTKGSILFYDHGNSKDALTFVNKALKINPEQPDLLLLKAIIYHYGLKDTTESLHLMEKSLEINPNHIDTLLIKAAILGEIKKPELSLVYIDQAYEINPKYPLILETQGYIYHYLRNYTEAVKYYDKFLEIYPDEAYVIEAKEFALKKIPYYSFEVENDPVVCAIEPDYDKDYPNLTSKMFDLSEIALDTWEKKLKDATGNYDKWNIHFKTIKQDILDTFDLENQCDVIFEYERTSPEFVSGLAFFSETYGKPIVVIYYLDIDHDFKKNKHIPYHTNIMSSDDYLISVNMHEFGHILGLEHYLIDDTLKESIQQGWSTPPSIMVEEIHNKLDITKEDTDAVIAIYGRDGFEYFAQIPEWVKSNAGWWANETIDDSTFASAIQFLIKEDIIEISDTVKTEAVDTSSEIPSWIKNNANWWSQELISDDDFIKGIEYMVKNGIIQV